jgi:Phage tail lysozyme
MRTTMNHRIQELLAPGAFARRSQRFAGIKRRHALRFLQPFALASAAVLAGCSGTATSGDIGASSSAVSGGACSEGDGYCTETLQCDNHHWVDRYDDPAACTSGPGASDYCGEGGGYCTASQQCENHHWVDRDDDPAACTSGPGASDSSNYCSEGGGYCTATEQCDNHHWVDRYDDPAACTSGPGADQGGGAPSGGSGVVGELDAEGYYGANLVALGKFLVAHGYSKAGAAGVAGCVAGESTGNPESEGTGGGGLIGWTPLSSIYSYGGTIGGNPASDLENQFKAILNYNSRNDPFSISRLNSFSNPVSAADFYSQVFERPLVLDSDVRASVANAVFSALGG